MDCIKCKKTIGYKALYWCPNEHRTVTFCEPCVDSIEYQDILKEKNLMWWIFDMNCKDDDFLDSDEDDVIDFANRTVGRWNKRMDDQWPEYNKKLKKHLKKLAKEVNQK